MLVNNLLKRGASSSTLYAEFIWNFLQIVNQWKEGSIIPIIVGDEGEKYWKLPFSLADKDIRCGPYVDTKKAKVAAGSVLRAVKQFEAILVNKLFHFDLCNGLEYFLY